MKNETPHGRQGRPASEDRPHGRCLSAEMHYGIQPPCRLPALNSPTRARATCNVGVCPCYHNGVSTIWTVLLVCTPDCGIRQCAVGSEMLSRSGSGVRGNHGSAFASVPAERLMDEFVGLGWLRIDCTGTSFPSLVKSASPLLWSSNAFPALGTGTGIDRSHAHTKE